MTNIRVSSSLGDNFLIKGVQRITGEEAVIRFMSFDDGILSVDEIQRDRSIELVIEDDIRPEPSRDR